MATVFGDGQMNDLPVGVVDHDFSATSRAIARAIDSSPKLATEGHYTSYHEATTALRRGQIYGFVVIPHNFEEDLVAAHRPTIECFYQYALLSAGAQVASTLEMLLTTLSLAPLAETATQLAIPPTTTEALLMPLTANTEPLFNPTFSYTLYLSVPFFFVMFQIVVLLMTVYSIGTEIKSATAVEWLTSADGRIGTAVVAKLVPHTLVFTAMGALGLWILSWSGAFAAPSDWATTLLYIVLLVVASQALGLFIFSIYPAMGLIISVASMVGSLGATLCGITFPLGAMSPIVE
jgi:ABC-2 type transport system permease protein